MLYNNDFKIMVALTNFHFKIFSLHLEDLVYFSEVRNLLRLLLDELSEKLKCRHEEYVLRSREQTNSVVVHLFNEKILDKIVLILICLPLYNYICFLVLSKATANKNMQNLFTFWGKLSVWKRKT